MSFSDSQVRAFKATNKRQKASCGDSLFLVMEPISKGGGKSFMGRIRFPPGRTSSVVDVRIGVYGKGTGKWSLKEARDEWELIRAWSRENNKDPRDRKREQKGTGPRAGISNPSAGMGVVSLRLDRSKCPREEGLPKPSVEPGNAAFRGKDPC